MAAVPVQGDLPDPGRPAERRLERGDRDELALRELDDVVPSVEVLVGVRAGLRHHVAGPVEAVLVEDGRGDVRTVEVPGDHGGALHEQFAPGVGTVGDAVAELRHVDELVLGDRRLLDDAVPQDAARLGRAVQVVQGGAEAALDPGAELRGQRGARADRLAHAAAQGPDPQVRLHGGTDCGGVGVRCEPALLLAVALLPDHLGDAGHEDELGRCEHPQVLEQRRQVGRGREGDRAAAAERREQCGPSGEVARRQVGVADHLGLGVVGPEGVPEPLHHAVRVHRALRGPGAARRVEQQRERVLPGRGTPRRRTRQVGAPGHELVEGRDRGRRVVLDVPGVHAVEQQRADAGVRRVDDRPRRRGLLGRHREPHRGGLVDDRAERRDRCTRLERDAHRPEDRARQVERHAVRAHRTQCRHPVPGRDGLGEHRRERTRPVPELAVARVGDGRPGPLPERRAVRVPCEHRRDRRVLVLLVVSLVHRPRPFLVTGAPPRPHVSARRAWCPPAPSPGPLPSVRPR